MQIKQVELKDFKIKALVSLDKSMRLTIDVGLENNSIDINELKSFMHKPLMLNLEIDNE